MAGKPFRFGAACIAKCADWAWHKSMTRLRGWQGDKADGKMCLSCEATFTGEDCYDFNASRKRQKTTMSGFTSAAIASQYISPIFSIPGFGIDFMRIDWMHTLDLGCVQATTGSALWEMFKQLRGTYKKPLVACERLTKMSKAMADEMDIEPPFSHLTVTMIRSAAGKKAYMKLKAAEGRRYIPILARMILHFFGTAGRWGLIYNCISQLAKAYEIMENWSSATAGDLASHGRKYLLLCKLLRDSSTDPLVWRMYPKHHLALHCFETVTNPRTLWNYGDESAIGKAVQIAKKANGRELHRMLIQRYITTFHFLE